MDKDKLVVPNPLKNLAPLQYDMQLVHRAENRVDEISVVNPAKGQELLSLFTKAAFQLSKIYSDLQFQLTLINKRVNDRKAILIVDVIPSKIKEKGLQQNEVTRQALLDLDEEYNVAADILAKIEAYVVYVDKHLKAIEGALSSIRKIYDATHVIYRQNNPHLITQGILDTPDLKSPEESPESSTTNKTIKYGKAVY